MTKKKFWNIAKELLKVVITLFSLYIVSTKIDFSGLKEVAFNANPFYLSLAFLSFFFSIVTASWRLNTFFKGIQLMLPEFYNFKLYLLGMFYNLFLPGGIGGDGYKVYFLRKKFNYSTRKLITCIFFDRLSGLWALCLITAMLIIFIPSFGIPNWVSLVSTFSATVLYGFIMYRFFPEYAIRFYFKHAKAIAVQSLQIICVIFILYALNFNGKFSPYLLLFLLSQIIAIVPISIGGLGARELVFISGANYLELDPHRAVLISLISYFISAIISLMGSYLIFNPKALGEHALPSQHEMERAKKMES